MAESASRSPTLTPRPIAIGIGVAAGALLAAAIALWAHYGSAVFFEMIATGLAACF